MFANIREFQTLANKVITVLFLGSILVSIVTAHQCYICGSFGNGKPNRNLVISCTNFMPNDSKFVQECGTDSRGCSIITNGSIVTRSCERYAIEDCKMANNVEYCYCSTELCNKYHPTFIDDEDLIGNEGSGDKIVKTTGINTETSKTTHKDTATVPEIAEKSTMRTKLESSVTSAPETSTKATNATVRRKQIIDVSKNITELPTTTRSIMSSKATIRPKMPDEIVDNPEVSNGSNLSSNVPKYLLTIFLLFIIFLNN